MAQTPWDARWHLRAELASLLDVLADLLAHQRGRGRTSAADAVRGFVIEDGEAEGLIDDLRAAWASPPAGRSVPSSPALAASRARADQGVTQGAFLPLRHAARAFRLSEAERNALLLALAVDVDARFGRLVAYLNDHVGKTRPTVGLALALAGDVAGAAAVDLCAGTLVRDGLVELEGDGPLPGLALRLARDVLRRLVADDRRAPDVPGVRWHEHERGLFKRLVLAPAVRDPLVAWVEAARRRPERPPALVLAGAAGTGRATVARATIGELGLPLVQVDGVPDRVAEWLPVARREMRWYGAGLLVRAPETSAAMDWSALWRGLADVPHPVVLAVPPAAVEAAAAAAPEEPAIVRVDVPAAPLRAQLWQALLPPGEPLAADDLAAVAARFRFGPRRIARAVRRATAATALAPAGARRLTPAALEAASREVGAAAMGPLAQKLPLPFARQELVVPARVGAELDLALAWVREQPTVLDRWGFGRRVPLGRGLTALFSGPPGTGKTMAAQVLARELGLDLYRVDLSRVMSKYIGETEQNLGALFDESSASGAVLFFDEADALFGKRSEVKDAHDRYANVEIGYLLQRMEEYEGVTVLATNRMQDLDEAFIRRFHVIADFPMPEAADRLRIWQGMLPAEAERDADLDLDVFARDFEISGGEIRNAALAAAFLAAAEGRPIGVVHVKRALRRELMKSGRVVDEERL